jgi:hypothetical protein
LSAVSRARFVYVALAVVTIGVGLVVYRGGGLVASRARDVLGDALWAAMMVWWISAIWPRARLTMRSGAAYAVCVCVELSQLYHTAALDAARATRVGHLALGSGFDPRDFLSYGLGVAGAVVLDRAARSFIE